MILALDKRLRTLRDASGLSQARLGAKVGITGSMIGSYETGHRLPSLEVLVALARVFGVTTDYLLGIDKDPSVSVDVKGLTPSQIQAVHGIIEEFQRANK